MPVSVPLETVGGLVCCVRPEELPEGASPRNYDIDFAVGRWYQRPGRSSVYSYAGSAVGPEGGGQARNVAITGNAWTGVNNVLANDGSYASTTPGTGSDALQISAFPLDMPDAVTPTGVTVAIAGYATTDLQLQVQLILNGVAVGTAKTVTMPTVPGVAGYLTLGGAGDVWGATLTPALVNSKGFGIQITASSAFALAQANLGYVTLTVAQTVSNANVNYLKTFVANDGTVVNLVVDASGAWWMENVTTNPGVLTLVMDGLTPGSFASSSTAQDGEFIAFSDLTQGSDLPRKFTLAPQTMDRVSQVGPGAPPTFAASSASTTQYPIETITQPPQRVYGHAYFLQSTGPGSTTPGNVVTVYYQDATDGVADADLVAAFNSGNSTYLRTQFYWPDGPVTQGPTTALVTSVGEGSPPTQPRQFFYYTYVVPTTAYTYYQGDFTPGNTATYQRTLATLTTTVPVPQLTVGTSAVVTGSSVAEWDSTWPITQTLNSGAMTITQTSLTAGVATFSYALASGVAPTVGQLVTITGTLNANGTLNGVNLVIASVTGTNIGTFTVSGFSAVTDYPAESEEGQATTAGTEFTFEPGLLTLGGSDNPIYGNATGGELSITGVGQYIGAGTRQGVVFFITRNGYQTCPSPPVTFSCPAGTTAILASQIPIGPPNVIARGIAFTEAGANGVPGGNFFTIPNPVQYIVQNVTYTASSLVIKDNTSTTATFSFPDATLLNATAIDVQGNDLFNQIELGNPAWVLSYASRNFYGLTQNKLQNFLNLSFDGGYLPGGQLTPLGWTTPDSYGQLQVSPIFGNSYYIQNTTAGTLATAGLIAQSAYQDAYLVPILQPNVAYSLRVSARAPSGLTGGNLVIDLVAAGISYGSFTLPFSAMTGAFTTYVGTLLTSVLPTIPAGLQLRLYSSAIVAGADVEIDRVEVFPTLAPVNQTGIAVSYANNLEAIADTGELDTSADNSQICYGGAVVLDELYLLKERSMYSTQDSPNYEPGGDPGWGVHEVSQAVGTCGVNAFDYGDEWLLTMCQSGVYGFNGGRPEPVARELQSQNGPTEKQTKGLWESIRWEASKSFWLRNDIINRRFYCGVALPTPNFWLPNAAANPAPDLPNVILMCNYEGCATFDDLISADPVHTTIMGVLKALEQRRKWSIWQIPCPYMANVRRTTGPELTLLLANGVANGKIYELVPQQTTDDGQPMYPVYTSYGFVTATQGQSLQLGSGRKLASYWMGDVKGNGLGGLRFYANTLQATYPQTNPLALRLQPEAQDLDERKVEISGQRIFVEISGRGDGQGGGGYIEAGMQQLDMAPHPWNVKRGIAL